VKKFNRAFQAGDFPPKGMVLKVPTSSLAVVAIIQIIIVNSMLNVASRYYGGIEVWFA